MTVWDMNRMMGWSTRAVIAAVVLAALLVAAVPVAFFAGLILMLFGHILVGLALFGASVLAAIGAVVVAGVSGVHHLRKMVTQLVSQRGYEDRVVQLRPGEYDYQ
jgi:hypothetical protein